MAIQSRCAPSERRQVSTCYSASCLRQWPLFCYAVLSVLSSFSIRERELIAASITVIMPWFDPWSVIVAFPGYTHLLFFNATSHIFIRRLGPRIYCLPPKYQEYH